MRCKRLLEAENIKDDLVVHVEQLATPKQMGPGFKSLLNLYFPIPPDKKLAAKGGPHSIVDSILASHSAAPGSILGSGDFFSWKNKN